MHSLGTLVRLEYVNTLTAFYNWSTNELFAPFVLPLATAQSPGFAILYTPLVEKPRVCIIGQNPANFAGRASWKTDLNRIMLRPCIPSSNSYLADDHDFARALRNQFAAHPELLQEAVGLNVWHFQARSDDVGFAPRELKRFCAATTRKICRR